MPLQTSRLNVTSVMVLPPNVAEVPGRTSNLKSSPAPISSIVPPVFRLTVLELHGVPSVAHNTPFSIRNLIGSVRPSTSGMNSTVCRFWSCVPVSETTGSTSANPSTRVPSGAGNPNRQISTAGRRFGLNAAGSKLGLLLGLLNIGGRKKKSGLPLCAPSDTANTGPLDGGVTVLSLHPIRTREATAASVKRVQQFMGRSEEHT